MVRCLRSQFLYTEKRPRDLLFDIFENALSVHFGSPPILAKLEREAATLAARSSARDNTLCANWNTASRALTNAMLRAGVLLAADGEIVAPDLSARATHIASLADNFREATEAYLLFVLIEQLKDIGVRDHVPLAHALFRRFDRTVSLGEMEDQLVILLATLQHQVILRPDGIYQAISNARNIEPPSKAL